MVTGDDDFEAAASGELLEALRFIRAVFDDPIDDISFEWTEVKALAVGHIAVEVLKANAALSIVSAAEADGGVPEISEDKINDYVSIFLDNMATRQIARNAEDA
jgi:hypothetical protein